MDSPFHSHSSVVLLCSLHPNQQLSGRQSDSIYYVYLSPRDFRCTSPVRDEVEHLLTNLLAIYLGDLPHKPFALFLLDWLSLVIMIIWIERIYQLHRYFYYVGCILSGLWLVFALFVVPLNEI